MTFCMLGWSAEAKTSPSAPCWICAARDADPAKLNFVMVPLSPDWLALTGAMGPHALTRPTAMATSSAATSRARISTSARSQLDDHVCCLEHRDRAHAGGEAELVGRLAGNQRHNPMWAGLHLDLRHNAILDDARHDARKVIARRPSDRRLRFDVGGCRRHEAS